MLFQEFRIWQRLNDIIISIEGDKNPLNQEQKQKLFVELTLREKLSDKEVLKLLKLSDDAELNFRKIDGNRTIHLLYKKFMEIAALTGNDVNEKKAASEIVKELEDIFESQGFNCNILHFDYDLEKKEYEKQPIFRLWHLLYSYEDDNSKTGNESLISKIADICSMPLEYAKVLAEIKFEDDYASLSHKAIKKLLPFLKQGDAYSDACEKAGYKHSKTSLTKEELETRALVEKLELLPKNSLRNPVVEKILNQMINLVNAVSEEYGKPDEIHIELSRKLKQSKEERKEATDYIAKNERRNEDIRKILLSDKFNLSSVSRNDIIKYKLYEELTLNGGHKTLYSDKHISPQELFSKEIDIEHIIPQSVLFDNSFANKTLEFSDVNRKKGKRTAFDFVASEYGPEGLQRYKARVEELLKQKKISKTKRDRLLMKESEIPSDFLERDLKETQYITKKAKEILEGYASRVMTTTGSVTAKLREDWGLINVLRELNMDKYEKLGLVEYKERLDSSSQKEIKYWTKRNDHRHHAVDAITVAFTRPSHIQLLNNLAAKSDKSSSIYRIRHKETHRNGNGKLVFNSPIPYNELRDKVKELLQGILVSHKAKNKVVTKNVNRTKCSGGFKTATNYTPRDYLHEDSIYGLIKRYETSLVPVNGKLTEEIINTVSNPKERNALLRRLREYGSDPKKAFTGKNALSKNPLNIEPDGSRLVLDKVKCTYLKKVYTLRKGVDKTLSVKDVVDDKVRRILEERIKAKGGTQEKAFENLEADPIWMNEAKRIPIRRVKIKVNFKESSVAALHSARDIMGQVLKDKKGMDIPADFVKFGNNHHVAIYKDAEGNYQEKVVTFFEAVHRANMGQDIVDKSYKSSEGWSFVFSMKSNEMFVFPNKESGFDPNEIDLKDPANYAAISPNLFRVQKLSSKYYNFRHHLETVQDYKPQISKKLNFDENQYQGTQDDLKKERDKVLKNETDLYTNKLQNITWKRITSIDKLKGVVKVRINHLGKIVAVGEE